MDRKTAELYSKEELVSLRKKKLALVTVSAVTAALTLAVCVFLCTKATVYTSGRLLPAAIIISVIGGWTVLSIRIFGIDAVNAAAKHVSAILEGPRERICGRFELTDEKTVIKKGVPMFRVKCEGGPHDLHLYDKKAKLFDERADCVHTVYGFIAAYEVENEDN